MDDFFDEEQTEVENMRSERKRLKEKDFAKLINKRDISGYELDELFS